MHWHTETTVAGLAGPKDYQMDLAPNDSLTEQPDQAIIDATYVVAQDLAAAIGAPDDALVSIDRHRDADTSAQSVSVMITVA